MIELREDQLLEDVFDAFVASDASPNRISLTRWIERYPQYEGELTEFAASWTLMTSLPPAPDAEKADEETLVLRGMSVLQNLLYEQQQARATTVAPFESLIAEGRAHDLGPTQLAGSVGIGVSLLRKLDRRLISYATIPLAAIDEIAAAIQREAASVVSYLQQGPTLATAAQYRSEQAPELAEPEDFFHAVRTDPTMTDEQRGRWLALESRDS